MAEELALRTLARRGNKSLCLSQWEQELVGGTGVELELDS